MTLFLPLKDLCKLMLVGALGCVCIARVVQAEDSFDRLPIIWEEQLTPFSFQLREGISAESGKRQTVLRIESVAPFQMSPFVVPDPPLRVAIDVIAEKPKEGKVFSAEASESVKRIRVGVHPDKTRLVLDIKGKVPPEISVMSDSPTVSTVVLTFAGAVGRVERPDLVPQPQPTVSEAPQETALPEVTPVAGEAPQPAELTFTPTHTATAAATAVPVESDTELHEVATPTRAPIATKTSRATASPTPKGEEQPAALPSTPEAPANVGRGSVDAKVTDGERGKELEIPEEKLREISQVHFSVDKVLLSFKEGARLIEDITVRNPGKKPIYVTAVPQLVTDSGTSREKRIDTQDLFVSPKRFQVDAESERAVRVVLKGLPPALERYYEIAFSVNRESFDSEYVTVDIEGQPTKLRVITDLVIVVLAEPPAPKVLIGVERDDSEVRLVNRGTVSVRLTGGKVCPPQAGARCASIPSRRLFPGTTMALKVPKNLLVSFLKDSVLGFEQLTIPALEK